MDAFWYAHDARLDESKLTPDEQWLGRTPEQQAAAFEETSRRRLRLVLDGLAALPQQPPIVVEGPQILPDLLPPAAAAVFLVPTRKFQQSLLAKRPLPPTENPRLALENRIEKDRLFAERVASLAATCGFEIIEVDGSRSPEEVLARVERSFASVLSTNRVPVDLRSVRRWENEVAAQNLRSWLASTDVPAEPPGPYSFACECGRRDCSARVALTLAEFDALPHVIAPRHATDGD